MTTTDTPDSEPIVIPGRLLPKRHHHHAFRMSPGFMCRIDPCPLSDAYPDCTVDHDSTATTAALPECANSGATSLSSEPSSECAAGAVGDRTADRLGDGIAQMLRDKARDLAKFAERAGYSRGHVDGYLQAIHACAEVVRCGGMVDAEYLTMLVNRPLVCRLCGDPLSEVERLMGSACGDCDKRGEDAR